MTGSSGGVSEWFKELVLKTSESERVRGFESYLLRYPGPLVKRSRHRPFTAVTRVRFSHGSFHPVTIAYGSVVQLVSTPACHAGGRGFEPLLSRFVLLESGLGRSSAGRASALQRED